MAAATEAKARSRPDEWALRDERRCLTWRETDDVLNRATNAILAAGLGEDGRVAIVSSNRIEIVLAHIAGVSAGVSTVPVNPKLTAAELEYIFRDADVRLVFADAGALPAVRQTANAIGGVQVVAFADNQSDETSWSNWLAAASPTVPPSHMRPKPHLVYTSGTTGKPKGVETPANMFPVTNTVAEWFELFHQREREAGDLSPSLAVSPMYHTAPMNLVRSFGGGSQLLVMSKFDAETVLRSIDEFGVRRVGMVPTHFQRLLDLPEVTRAKYRTDSLVMVTHTGAACPRHVKQAMIDWLGPILRETYGGSESGPTNRIFSEEWMKKAGSVGRTYPPFELLILDEDHNPLPPFKEGQIYFRDTTGRGITYYKDPEKTAQAHIAPGVFTLGDVGYQDDEGYLYISDRAADLIISGGVNIYPAEAEHRLMNHPQVLDVAVIGIPHRDMGEEARGLIIPRDPASPPNAEDLDRFCRLELAAYKCPRSYEIVDDVGRNSLGKINKKELRSRYWSGARTIAG